MRTSVRGCWLAMGLLLGCTPVPTEIVGSEGAGSTTGTGTGPSDGPSDASGPGSTGPVAEGSAGSGPGMPPGVDSGTTEPIDPTSDQGTSSSGLPEPTGPGTTTEPSEDDDEPPMPQTCDEIFGTADGYVHCSHDEDSCSFSAHLNGANCTAICGMFSQACLDALDNPGIDGDACFIQGGYGCDNGGKDTLICICARPS